MRISRITYCLTLATVLTWAFLSGCSRGPEHPTVTVSIEPQRWLLEQIVGDKAEVRSLLSAGANPETYDPTVTNLMNVSNSKAYMRLGNVGFEEAVIDKIKATNPGLPVFDTSVGITPITGTHSCGDHHHDEADPHIWTSVVNAKIMARNMMQAMVGVDKDNEAYYRKREARLQERLDSLNQAFAARLAPVRGRSFAVWHPSLSYLARDYGLNQVVLGGAENREISPTALKEVIDSAKRAGVKVMFSQRDFDSRQAASVNSSVGARQVDINPMAEQWQQEMERIVAALSGL